MEQLLDSLKYCQKAKGLEIFAWVIMTNHCHLILRAKEENLADIIRDLKKFTAKAIVRLIQENELESRKKWLAMTLTFENHIWFWEKGYHGEEIYSIPFYNSKMNYIHQNPVEGGFVTDPIDWKYSSARNYGNNDQTIL